MPLENVLTPDLVRRLCWSPPGASEVAGRLRAGGAREWQIALTERILVGRARLTLPQSSADALALDRPSASEA